MRVQLLVARLGIKASSKLGLKLKTNIMLQKAPVMTTPPEDVISLYSGICIGHLSRDGTKGCSYALTASPKLQHLGGKH
ncbi:hypothetical protein JTE90_018173 [Oedothorax gibbosus]|uniref:Uncharacterized protein n=1 Tax=Oedothorax gibbosus TaxID=931172 RepID=A0AAV6U9K0_9ARAC|nr:hypothetical protein JTE90_018173 [Oedothorax gibbosus]